MTTTAKPMFKASEIAPLANGQIRAARSFEEQLVEIAGITAEEAQAVRVFYLKNKLAKADPIMGRTTVKHGRFLDREVIRRAVDAAKS